MAASGQWSPHPQLCNQLCLWLVSLPPTKASDWLPRSLSLVSGATDRWLRRTDGCLTESELRQTMRILHIRDCAGVKIDSGEKGWMFKIYISFLQDQLLINGRNHLALKNALAQQMQQQIIPGQVPTMVSAAGGKDLQFLAGNLEFNL